MMMVRVESRTNSTVREKRKERLEKTINSNPDIIRSQKLTVVCISCTGYMYEGVVEIIIDQAVLEFLDEIQNSAVEFSSRASIVVKWLLRLNITVQNLLCKDVFLVQEQHDGCIRECSVITYRSEQF